MSHHLKKRKRRPFDTSGHADQDGVPQPDLSLFVQAHEADLVHGPQAANAARSLEVVRGDGQDVVGDGLIQWTGTRRDVNLALGASLSNDEDHLQLQGPAVPSEDTPNDRAGYWVDRYAVC